MMGNEAKTVMASVFFYWSFFPKPLAEEG